MRGPIILYYTPTGGHVSNIHLWIAASIVYSTLLYQTEMHYIVKYDSMLV